MAAHQSSRQRNDEFREYMRHSYASERHLMEEGKTPTEEEIREKSGSTEICSSGKDSGDASQVHKSKDSDITSRHRFVDQSLDGEEKREIHQSSLRIHDDDEGPSLRLGAYDLPFKDIFMKNDLLRIDAVYPEEEDHSAEQLDKLDEMPRDVVDSREQGDDSAREQYRHKHGTSDAGNADRTPYTTYVDTLAAFEEILRSPKTKKSVDKRLAVTTELEGEGDGEALVGNEAVLPKSNPWDVPMSPLLANSHRLMTSHDKSPKKAIIPTLEQHWMSHQAEDMEKKLSSYDSPTSDNQEVLSSSIMSANAATSKRSQSRSIGDRNTPSKATSSHSTAGRRSGYGEQVSPYLNRTTSANKGNMGNMGNILDQQTAMKISQVEGYGSLQFGDMAEFHHTIDHDDDDMNDQLNAVLNLDGDNYDGNGNEEDTWSSDNSWEEKMNHHLEDESNEVMDEKDMASVKMRSNLVEPRDCSKEYINVGSSILSHEKLGMNVSVNELVESRRESNKVSASVASVTTRSTASTTSTLWASSKEQPPTQHQLQQQQHTSRDDALYLRACSKGLESSSAGAPITDRCNTNVPIIGSSPSYKSNDNLVEEREYSKEKLRNNSFSKNQKDDDPSSISDDENLSVPRQNGLKLQYNRSAVINDTKTEGELSRQRLRLQLRAREEEIERKRKESQELVLDRRQHQGYQILTEIRKWSSNRLSADINTAKEVNNSRRPHTSQEHLNREFTSNTNVFVKEKDANVLIGERSQSASTTRIPVVTGVSKFRAILRENESDPEGLQHKKIPPTVSHNIKSGDRHRKQAFTDITDDDHTYTDSMPSSNHDGSTAQQQRVEKGRVDVRYRDEDNHGRGTSASIAQSVARVESNRTDRQKLPYGDSSVATVGRPSTVTQPDPPSEPISYLDAYDSERAASRGAGAGGAVMDITFGKGETDKMNRIRRLENVREKKVKEEEQRNKERSRSAERSHSAARRGERDDSADDQSQSQSQGPHRRPSKPQSGPRTGTGSGSSSKQSPRVAAGGVAVKSSCKAVGDEVISECEDFRGASAAAAAVGPERSAKGVDDVSRKGLPREAHVPEDTEAVAADGDGLDAARDGYLYQHYIRKQAVKVPRSNGVGGRKASDRDRDGDSVSGVESYYSGVGSHASVQSGGIAFRPVPPTSERSVASAGSSAVSKPQTQTQTQSQTRSVSAGRARFAGQDPASVAASVAASIAASVSEAGDKNRAKERERAESAGRGRERERNKCGNYQQVRNALQYVCLAGAHFEAVRGEVLAILDRYCTLIQAGDSHIAQFIILLSHTDALAFKGLYGYDGYSADEQTGGSLQRLYGRCPRLLPLSAVDDYIKYESSSKSFKKLPCHTITSTTDAVSINAQKMKKLVSNST